MPLFKKSEDLTFYTVSQLLWASKISVSFFCLLLLFPSALWLLHCFWQGWKLRLFFFSFFLQKKGHVHLTVVLVKRHQRWEIGSFDVYHSLNVMHHTLLGFYSMILLWEQRLEGRQEKTQTKWEKMTVSQQWSSQLFIYLVSSLVTCNSSSAR